MNEFTEYKLKSLSSWLLEREHSDEYCEANLLKTAISVEDATNTLNMSKRVPRAIKSIIWELANKHKESFDYDKKDLEYLSSIYRAKIISFIEKDPDAASRDLGRAADLTPGDKALAIQWLTSLASSDKSFAGKTLLLAIEAEGADAIAGSLLFRVKAKLIEEESRWPVAQSAIMIKNKLEKFFNWKKFMKERDLMAIKSWGEFYDITDDADEAIKEYNESKEYLDADVGTTELKAGEGSYSGAAWNAYVITNKGAACKRGVGTDWCTSAPGGDWFSKYYHAEDPIIMLEHKHDPDERFQVHFGTMQFKNTEDEEVAPIDQANIVNILNDFGSDRYLSAQLYNSYQNFASRDKTKPGHDEFMDLRGKLTSYMNEVIKDKLQEGSLEDPASYLPSKILEQVSTQIKEGHLMDFDSEVSDVVAQMLADYDPTEFFELKLDVDYPELVEGIIASAVDSDSQNKNIWREAVSPLNIYREFTSGSLFRNDSINDFFQESEGGRKQLITKIVKENGLSIFLNTEPMPAEATELLAKYYPTLRSDIAKSLLVKDTGEASQPFQIHTSLEYRHSFIELASLIGSSFYLEFPEEFKKIMDEIMVIIRKEQNPTGGHWWLHSAISAMSDANIVKRYYNYYAEFLKFGLKADFDSFTKYDSSDLPQDIKDEVSSLKASEEAAYVKRLLSGTDMVIGGWRDRDLDGETLYEIFATIEGSSASDGHQPTKYKPVAEFYHRILTILRVKIAESNSVGATDTSMSHPRGTLSGARKKIELPRELLLYVATLLPSLWSIFNLDHKVVSPSEITEKAARSMRTLEQEIERKKYAEGKPDDDRDDEEDDDDF
jgi:hypothetical protein